MNVNIGLCSVGPGLEPKLVCTICEPDAVSALQSATEAMDMGADILELRIDRLKSMSTVGFLLNQFKRRGYPTLVACRSKNMDGHFEGSESDRLVYLFRALEHHPDAIDIDLYSPVGDFNYESTRNCLIADAKVRGIPVLINYENFACTPPKSMLLSYVYGEECKAGADILKFAVMANHPKDALTVMNTALEAKKFNMPYVAIAMGDHGSLTRPMACVLGSSMTYCCAKKGKEGAPGQLTLAETRKVINSLIYQNKFPE